MNTMLVSAAAAVAVAVLQCRSSAGSVQYCLLSWPAPGQRQNGPPATRGVRLDRIRSSAVRSATPNQLWKELHGHLPGGNVAVCCQLTPFVKNMLCSTYSLYANITWKPSL